MTSQMVTRVFNRNDRFAEGWYFAMPSGDLRLGRVKALTLLGEELAIYRGDDGVVRAARAHCPHMGAHLAEGRVEGKGLRCFFHRWRFDAEGSLAEIPCAASRPRGAGLVMFPVAERYGLIWIWTGPQAMAPLPAVPELEGVETVSHLGGRFMKACHPNVVMINAIDAQHFQSVHPLVRKLAGRLRLEPETRGVYNIHFRNQAAPPRDSWLNRWIARFYRDELTYRMSYWFGSTGSVTLGPDFLHFHILFTLRPTPAGQCEGRTILVTKRRTGLHGRVLTLALLFMTKAVGAYFARGDTRIFKSIRFQLQHPIPEDQAIVSFIRHTERLPVAAWGWSMPPVAPKARADAPVRPLVSTPFPAQNAPEFRS